MWKWLAIIACLLWILVPASTVLAASSGDVTITATGIVVGAPGGFTLYYISDYEVGILWTKPESAVNTMIRAAIGRYPADRTDGYLVYYGNAENATDTGVSLDETVAGVYYKAWSETAEGEWSPLWAEDFIEGAGMTLIAFVALALGLLIATFALKSGRRILAYASAGAWLLLGVYSYTRFVDLWDIYYALFWLSMGIVFVCVLIPVILREKKEEDVTVEDIDEYGDKELLADIEASEKDRERLDRLFGSKRHKTRKLSKFARTGRE